MALPNSLKDQLKEGGRLVIPVGKGRLGQQTHLCKKHKDGRITEERIAVSGLYPWLAEKSGFHISSDQASA